MFWKKLNSSAVAKVLEEVGRTFYNLGVWVVVILLGQFLLNRKLVNPLWGFIAVLLSFISGLVLIYISITLKERK